VLTFDQPFHESKNVKLLQRINKLTKIKEQQANKQSFPRVYYDQAIPLL
jgi:hypothetical protein